MSEKNDVLKERVARMVEKGSGTRPEAKTATKGKQSVSEPVADLLLGSDYVIYYPVIAHMLESVPAAILLCKAWYWSRTENSNERDGWFWWTQADITAQTALGRKATDNAKALLREKGFIETDVRGVPPVVWWRIDKELFFSEMRLFMESLGDSKKTK